VCHVWREDLRTGRAERAPDPEATRSMQIGPAVDANGDVYFDRTDRNCGAAEVRRWRGDRVTVIERLPPGFAYQFAYLAPDGRTLYFDFGRCARGARDDIYALRLPPP
jgi:hypothetical protein